MKLIAQKDITNNKYSVIIKFKEYGSTTLTPEDEQKIIDDFSPKFKLSDITFTDKYKKDVNGKYVADKENGVEISLVVPNKWVSIDNLMEFGCTFHKKDIDANECGDSELTTVNDVAKAKIQLFIDKVTKHINEILKNLGETIDGFEEDEEIEVG